MTAPICPRDLPGKLSLTFALLALTACAEGRPQQPVAARGPSLRLVDSVTLAEADTALLARPVELTVDAHGSFYVSDMIARQVFRFARTGALELVFGRRGSGPGEFTAPFRVAPVGDSLVIVADRSLRRLTRFESRTARARGATRHEGVLYSSAPSGATVWFGLPNPERGTALARWDLATDSLRYLGRMPPDLVTSPSLPSMRLAVMVTPFDSGVVAAFSNVDAAWLFDGDGRVVREIALPVARRRGIPPDAETRARAARSPEAVYEILSTTAHVTRLSNGGLAIVHLDFSLAGTRLTARGFVTLINPELDAACVDGSIPFSSDAQPSVAFLGDTLFALDQFVTQQGVKSTIRGWTLETAACDWIPLGKRGP